jgi:hypothetical protein
MIAAIHAIEQTASRDITNPDDYINARAQMITNLRICRHYLDENLLDADEFERLGVLAVGFGLVHDHLAVLMRGALEPAHVLTEYARILTPPGEGGAPVTTPFGTTVFVSDWNGLASLFDADFEYNDVTPAVRDILLALTHSRAVPFGTTLELRIDFTSGRFICPPLNIDVFSTRPWHSFVDTTTPLRNSRVATTALQTLLREQNAVLTADGTLTVHREVGDALRVAYVPPVRTPTRNLAVPVRARTTKRVGVVGE